MLDTRVTTPQSKDALTIVPLVAAGGGTPRWTLLNDGIAAGTLRISEIGTGTVPRLLATNSGKLAVLILDGEQLVGARQNRTTNRSILVAAGTEIEIPVSCMEQGRWRFTSDAFRPAPQHSPVRVRRKAREVEASAVADGYAPSDRHLAEAQGAVWAEIADLSHNLHSASPTGALDDTFRSRNAEIDAFLPAFPLVPDQVGFVGLVNGEPIGLDVIGSTHVYALVHDRLTRGYILDALNTAALRSQAGTHSSVDTGSATEERVSAFLDQVRGAARTAAPSVGIGNYSVLSGAVIGGELSDDAVLWPQIVHLSAFPARARNQDPIAMPIQEPIAPPSQRRRT